MEAEDPLQSALCEELDMDVWALREGDNQEEYFSFSFWAFCLDGLGG